MATYSVGNPIRVTAGVNLRADMSTGGTIYTAPASGGYSIVNIHEAAGIVYLRFTGDNAADRVELNTFPLYNLRLGPGQYLQAQAVAGFAQITGVEFGNSF